MVNPDPIAPHQERSLPLETLRTSEERYRQLAEAMPQLVWTADDQGHVDYYNSRGAEYAGLVHTPEGVWEWQPIVHPEDLDATLAAWEKAVRSGQVYECAHRIRMVDGSHRWHLSRAIPVRNEDGTARWFGTATDIHELRSAQEALRQNEEKFRVVLKSSRILVYTTDRELRYTWIHNPHPSFRVEDVLGRRDDELLPPEKAAPLIGLKQKVLDSGVGARDEFEVFLEEKRHIYDVTAEPWRNASGEITGVAVAALEITERKLAEEELQKAAFELAKADRQKNDFLAMLAHELRNPLSPIRSTLDLLAEKRATDPEVARGCDLMGRQVDHLTRLIDDLLDVSRISRNRLELRRQACELGPILAAAIESVRPLMARQEHELVVRLPEEPVFVNGDAVRLAQVFINLLSNAAKYTPAGGTVTLQARQEAQEVKVSVQDTGIGIPLEQLSQVFDMFYQADRSLERSVGGLGVGLTLARRLVEMHGGRIEAHSEGAGKGSELIVRLPTIDHAPAAEPAPVSTDHRFAGVSRRILVADDNLDAVESLALLLEMAGQEVRKAHDGQHALEVAQQFRPEVAILDVGMPRLNGYELARRIREEPWGGSVVLIAQTGWGQEEDLHRSREAGFDAHLVKPVDLAQLKRVVVDLWEARVLEELAARQS